MKKETDYVQNNEMFKFLNSDSNVEFSKMKGLDLQYLIILIDKYYIYLREQLGLEQYITLGLELEFENAKKYRIYDELDKTGLSDNHWGTKHDGSLDNGLEINSPILKDIKEDWQNLSKICSIVSHFAKIGVNSGGHIHI